MLDGTSSQSDYSDNEDMYVHNMTLKQAKQLLNSPRSRQIITLASCGKKVGVVECGDPNGYPVLWFTGNMGPALSILLYHNIAKRHRIRFVCVDRPGYNASDDIYSEPGVPDLFEFADMINELTLILRMWQFGLATFSLGAVYGLAYSLNFPERLKGPIFMISPWLSVKTPGTSTMYKGIARYAPNFLIRTTLSTLPHMNNFINMWSTLGSSPVKSPKRVSTSTSTSTTSDSDDGIEDADIAFAISPGRSYIHQQIYANGLWNLQNRTGAHIDAMVALEKVSWGYSYEETNYPIEAFVGDIDENVPIQAWMYMNNRMNNIELNVIEGGGHYILYRMDFMEDLFTQIERSMYS
ncbi:2113_t:CDS:2 [Funneliformis caledonium]|uniref:2113_t:CDS:1 n=1 Tax=Funneliformis caledonium TaxID=1117310 RepID=A0A9N9CNV9_9GLOM|nr:2113_t:CDS:2 [Funneliformis caledonium]